MRHSVSAALLENCDQGLFLFHLVNRTIHYSDAPPTGNSSGEQWSNYVNYVTQQLHRTNIVSVNTHIILTASHSHAEYSLSK